MTGLGTVVTLLGFVGENLLLAGNHHLILVDLPGDTR